MITDETDIDIEENDDLDDVEPIADEARLYEHFRVVVDKGQEMVRVDKYLFDRITNSSRNRIQKAADALPGETIGCHYGGDGPSAL